MKAYIGTFVKKDGTLRNMTFANIEDLPKEFLEKKLKNTGRKVTLAEGQKVVYDLEIKDFRIFNHNSLIGELDEIEVDTIRPVEYDGSTSI